RPMACVVRAEGSSIGAKELSEFLASRVAKWWLPERWSFIDEVPKTSVGKFDKKLLRAQHEEGRLEIDRLD
ncbi:MAG: fatty acid--CoA ligase, partial [Myxococcota bacterium]